MVYFVAAYLIALVPMIYAVHALAYFICAVMMLWECFGRPRATVAVYSNACGAAGFAVIVGVLIMGLYAVAGWFDYDPTLAILAAVAWPGVSQFRWLFPLLRRDAESEAKGERSRLQAELQAVVDSTPVPRPFGILFQPIRWKPRPPAPPPRARRPTAKAGTGEPPLLEPVSTTTLSPVTKIPPRLP